MPRYALPCNVMPMGSELPEQLRPVPCVLKAEQRMIGSIFHLAFTFP